MAESVGGKNMTEKKQRWINECQNLWADGFQIGGELRY